MLGERIKEFRTKSNLTQKQLADKIGVAKATIGMWENNNREPDIKVLMKLADVFHCYVTDLLNDVITLDDAFQEDELEFHCPVCGHTDMDFLKTVTITFNNEKTTGRGWQFYCQSGHTFYLTIKQHKGIIHFAFLDEHLKYIESINSNYSKADEIMINSNRDLLHYFKLDTYGKKAVDSILDVEYRRCNDKHDIEVKKLEAAARITGGGQRIPETPPESIFQNVVEVDDA